jgi:putative sterol carrier protein
VGHRYRKSFHIDIADGSCSSAIGAAESPRVTLGFELPNFIKFIAGKLDGMQAFMGGQLKLTGDMMYAQQMQTFFDT